MSSAEDGEIILYDLPSKPPCKAWSLNPWKVRIMLNFKGLKYRTEWLEYPDIKPTLEGRVPPRDTDPPYTIPTIRLPSGTYINDSAAIAQALEQAHPSPRVHLDSAMLPRVGAALDRAFAPVRAPVLRHLIPPRLLNEASHAYWYATRFDDGAPCEYRPEDAAAAYDAARPALEELTALLREDGAGPFFLGGTVSFADFVWAGAVVFFRRIGEDVAGEMMARTGDEALHERFMEAMEPWMRRDDR